MSGTNTTSTIPSIVDNQMLDSSKMLDSTKMQVLEFPIKVKTETFTGRWSKAAGKVSKFLKIYF